MMGLGVCSLYLATCIALSSFEAAKSKTLAAVSRVSADEEPGVVVARYRRDALPYEGEMFAYPPSDTGLNEAYYPKLASEAALARLGLGPREREQMERLGLALSGAEKPARLGPEGDERLGQALQQLMEDSRRRDQEAAYLSNLLRAWNELSQPEAYPAEADPRDSYPDYDELAPVRQAANRRPPELGRYGNREAAYNTPARPDLEEPTDGGREVQEQVMRYLVGRILADMDANADYPRPPRLVKRDLRSLAEPRPKAYAGARRVRRALDKGAGRANLVRVKRLGSGAEGEGEEEENEVVEEDDVDNYLVQAPNEAQVPVSLQRMKRIDGQFQEPGTPARSRRYASYQGPEHVIRFLPD
ncbi:proprotein convertase subtilisin/kexin type 1 inhibitor, like [Heterodontus francisci]|uniref:proprotein convertase subtilisin/kexin type 1 inhibitor, like n=1 Tax=Heterodontus francisci TaxID=7792 RepID=UPI00355C76A3